MKSDERARVPAYVMYADLSATAFGDLALPDLPNQVDCLLLSSCLGGHASAARELHG